jgi:Zn-finger nucleic acid-binding protein
MPVDDTELVMSSREGSEIDYSLNCRSVWLGRGELDKIIEWTNRVGPPSMAYGEDRYGKHGKYDRPYRKKKSLLGDLFDF